MRRVLGTCATGLWMWGLGLAALGCGDSSVSSNATPLSVSVVSQDSIVSEDGVLALESRTIGPQSTVEVVVSLGGMFFYLSPLTDSVDGVYDAGDDARDFLTMDLLGMFDLRVSP